MKSQNKGPMAPVQMKTEQMKAKGTPEKTQVIKAQKTLQEIMKGKPVNRLK